MEPAPRPAPAPAPLTRDLLPATAQVLARAFRDNAGFVYSLRGVDRAGREAIIRRAARSFAATVCRRGQAAVVRDAAGAVAGAALAYPPGAYPLSPLGWLENALGALTIGPLHSLRLARVDAHMRRHHLRAPHWYLFMLGVDPDQQGTGKGGALLRWMSARADRDGVPCFLETDMEQNVRLYQHHGYEVVREGPTSLGFTMWHMIRPARR